MSDLVLVKTCSNCKEIKLKTEFGTRNKGKYLRSYCKSCQAIWRKRWYKNNTDRQRELSKRWEREQKELFRSLKSRPCRDCRIQYPYYVMQFDHVRGEKLFSIGARRNKVSKKRLLEEIAKCEVVCANCHAERTYQRRCSS